MDVRAALEHRGGFATRFQLVRAGVSDRMLSHAVESGAVARVRRGWYSSAEPTDPRFIAVRAGGRLTGTSAIDAWGGWVWNRPARIQVAVPAHAGRLPLVDGVQVHYESLLEPGGTAVVSAVDALIRVMIDENADNAIPCLDWCLAAGRIRGLDIHRLRAAIPNSRRHLADLADPRSQSVLESVARIRLVQAGFSVRSQQPTGVRRSSDLVIEDHVVLETDGREFHADWFERDRARDLVTTIEGRHVIRVSASMVRHRWPLILSAIREALSARGVTNSGESVRFQPARQRAHRSRGEVT